MSYKKISQDQGARTIGINDTVLNILASYDSVPIVFALYFNVCAENVFSLKHHLKKFK